MAGTPGSETPTIRRFSRVALSAAVVLVASVACARSVISAISSWVRNQIFGTPRPRCISFASIAPPCAVNAPLMAQALLPMLVALSVSACAVLVRGFCANTAVAVAGCGRRRLILSAPGMATGSITLPSSAASNSPPSGFNQLNIVAPNFS